MDCRKRNNDVLYQVRYIPSTPQQSMACERPEDPGKSQNAPLSTRLRFSGVELAAQVFDALPFNTVEDVMKSEGFH